MKKGLIVCLEFKEEVLNQDRSVSLMMRVSSDSESLVTRGW